MESETNLVVFHLRWTGTSLLLQAEPVEGGPQAFAMQGVQLRRFQYEGDVLRALEHAGVGHWSSFPSDNIQATVTRLQLRTIGFRGNY